jgi:hypothetical protein
MIKELNVDDYPIVMNVDSNSLMVSIVRYHQGYYDSNLTYKKLYTAEKRKIKLKNILNKL